jgi:phosphoribosylformylglycinamidine synthase
VVGRVTGDGRVRVRHRGRTVADLPVQPLSEQAPRYDRPRREPGYLADTSAWQSSSVPEREAAGEDLRALLGSPNIASKRWVWEQYDHTVRANTVAGPGSDAAVMRIPGTSQGFALTTDGPGRHCWLDPRGGAAAAVAEAARNLSSMGAEPVAVTDCLNFGNPEKPEIMWQFQQTVEGIRDACLALGVPVVSGNVSFYNETDGKPIRPTPVIGMVGSIADVTRTVRSRFHAAGDLVVLLGPTLTRLDGSEFLALRHGVEAGRPEPVDFEVERAVQATCRDGIRSGWIRSAHDCSIGGLLVTVAESCFGVGTNLGVDLGLETGGRLDTLLFGEAPSRIVVTVEESALARLQEAAARLGTEVAVIGRVLPEPVLKVRVGGERVVREEVGRLRTVWEDGLQASVFGDRAAARGGPS